MVFSEVVYYKVAFTFNDREIPGTKCCIPKGFEWVKFSPETRLENMHFSDADGD